MRIFQQAALRLPAPRKINQLDLIKDSIREAETGNGYIKLVLDQYHSFFTADFLKPVFHHISHSAELFHAFQGYKLEGNHLFISIAHDSSSDHYKNLLLEAIESPQQYNSALDFQNIVLEFDDAMVNHNGRSIQQIFFAIDTQLISPGEFIQAFRNLPFANALHLQGGFDVCTTPNEQDAFDEAKNIVKITLNHEINPNIVDEWNEYFRPLNFEISENQEMDIDSDIDPSKIHP